MERRRGNIVDLPPENYEITRAEKSSANHENSQEE
jgi:hypothetical protein